MFEKVNPSHPDKVADRIAGAVVDLAYAESERPSIAVEVLLGHGICHIITESSVVIDEKKIETAVSRIAGSSMKANIIQKKQDVHLAENQSKGFRCGDNGIFRGVPVTDEQKKLTSLAREIYEKFPYDGKYIIDGEKIIICQSHAKENQLRTLCGNELCGKAIVNPLGEWTGGPDVDCGATNRKLGSDMADSVTGGGLCGKDLSKADVSVNIYAFCKAQETGEKVEYSCAIGDDNIAGIPYSEIVDFAADYVKNIGGFEKFAEWGLVR